MQKGNSFNDKKFITKGIPCGNGFFVSDYFVTTAHVIDEAGSVEISKDICLENKNRRI